MIKKMFSISRYPEFFLFLLWRHLTPIIMRRRGVALGNSVEFFGTPIVTCLPGTTIRIEDKASLCSVSTFTALGVHHPVILRTLRPGAKIIIGAHSGLSGTTICAGKSVIIGEYCLLGANVIIMDTDFHPTRADNRRYNNSEADIACSEINIGNNVFLGTGTVVCKGVTIGANSIIGAGSIVTRSVPANSIAAGNPARVIGMIPM